MHYYYYYYLLFLSVETWNGGGKSSASRIIFSCKIGFQQKFFESFIKYFLLGSLSLLLKSKSLKKNSPEPSKGLEWVEEKG